jgi:hypothetical protein
MIAEQKQEKRTAFQNHLNDNVRFYKKALDQNLLPNIPLEGVNAMGWLEAVRQRGGLPTIYSTLDHCDANCVLRIAKDIRKMKIRIDEDGGFSAKDLLKMTRLYIALRLKIQPESRWIDRFIKLPSYSRFMVDLVALRMESQATFQTLEASGATIDRNLMFKAGEWLRTTRYISDPVRYGVKKFAWVLPLVVTMGGYLFFTPEITQIIHPEYVLTHEPTNRVEAGQVAILKAREDFLRDHGYEISLEDSLPWAEMLEAEQKARDTFVKDSTAKQQ